MDDKMKEVLKNRAKKDFEAKQYQDFTTIAQQAPFISNGKAVFYSGDNNWDRAKDFAKANNMTPINKSFGGGILDKGTIKSIGSDKVNNRKQPDQRFGSEMTKKLWNVASRRYAAQVKGNVKTFVCGSGPDSVFRKTELPTILNNKNVKEINGIDKTKVDQLRRSRFNSLRQQGIAPRAALAKANETAYRKVAVSEIRQDLDKAKTTQSDTLAKDARVRLRALRQQNKLEVLKAKVQKEKTNALNLQQTAKNMEHSVGQSNSINQSQVKAVDNIQEKTISHNARVNDIKHETKDTLSKTVNTESFSKESFLNKGH